jgi:hypothetical protein
MPGKKGKEEERRAKREGAAGDEGRERSGSRENVAQKVDCFATA